MVTATVFETDVDQAVDEEISLDKEEPCDGLTDDLTQCEQPAIYRCYVKCCGSQFGWCEECLFVWLDYARIAEGMMGVCAFCESKIEIEANHVVVVGRIK